MAVPELHQQRSMGMTNTLQQTTEIAAEVGFKSDAIDALEAAGISIGSILQINPTRRMVYLGNGFACAEALHSDGAWKQDAMLIKKALLTDKQATFWLSKIV